MNRHDFYERILIGALTGVILLMTGLITFSGKTVKKLYVSFVKTKQWGGANGGSGQLRGPQGIALDSDGSLWVAERENHRIQKFSPDGTSLLIIGKKGTGPLQFSSPDSLAVDAAGNIFVADTWNHRIQKISKTGKFLTWWGSKNWKVASRDGEFFGPRGVAVDSQGNVYVADTGNHRIQKFNNVGKFIKAWGSKGPGDDQLNEPIGIAVDNKDFVYVADTHNRAVKKFTTEGRSELKWPIDGWKELRYTAMGFIGLDNADRIYVSDSAQDVVFVYVNNGAYVGEWKNDTNGSRMFHGPSGVTVDSVNIFVADGNNRIQRFTR